MIEVHPTGPVQVLRVVIAPHMLPPRLQSALQFRQRALSARSVPQVPCERQGALQLRPACRFQACLHREDSAWRIGAGKHRPTLCVQR